MRFQRNPHTAVWNSDSKENICYSA